MQRVVHSILTARVLLDLREAVSRDRARKETACNGTDSTLTLDETGQPSAPTALSSIIIRVDSWFQDTGTTTQGTEITMV
jgi:hypothetical protein